MMPGSKEREDGNGNAYSGSRRLRRSDNDRDRFRGRFHNLILCFLYGNFPDTGDGSRAFADFAKTCQDGFHLLELYIFLQDSI